MRSFKKRTRKLTLGRKTRRRQALFASHFIFHKVMTKDLFAFLALAALFAFDLLKQPSIMTLRSEKGTPPVFSKTFNFGIVFLSLFSHLKQNTYLIN